MAKSMILLAKAGTGKTTFITSGLKEKFKYKNVLFITYTNQNTENLKEKLARTQINFSGYDVLTFYQFLERMFIKPNKHSIQRAMKLKIKVRGLIFRSANAIKATKLKRISKKSSKFWQSDSGDLYADKLAKLIVDRRTESIFEASVKRLALFYDYIVIDEFQDIVKPEIDVIKKMGKFCLKEDIGILMVGDLYQSCVVTTSMQNKPYQSFAFDMDEESFIRTKLKLPKRDFDIDTSTLNTSFRVSEAICKYIRTNLNIQIFGKNMVGEIVEIKTKKDIYKLISNLSCQFLVNDVRMREKVKKFFSIDDKRIINYGVSKGMEYSEVAVFLTDPLTKAFKNNFTRELKRSSLNKFYVALTRTRGNVYLIPSTLIDSVK